MKFVRTLTHLLLESSLLIEICYVHLSALYLRMFLGEKQCLLLSVGLNKQVELTYHTKFNASIGEWFAEM